MECVGEEPIQRGSQIEVKICKNEVFEDVYTEVVDK